jgi:hypothetical protein
MDFYVAYCYYKYMIARILRRWGAVVLILLFLVTAGSCGLLELFGFQGPAAPELVVSSTEGIVGNLVQPGTNVLIDISGSFDPNGDPFGSSWSLSRPAGSSSTLMSASGAVASFLPTALVDGKYVLEATLSDGRLENSYSLEYYTPGALSSFEAAWSFNSNNTDISPTPKNLGGGPANFQFDRFDNLSAASGSLEFISTDSATYAPLPNVFKIDSTDSTNGSFTAMFWIYFINPPADPSAVISHDTIAADASALPGWRIGVNGNVFGLIADTDVTIAGISNYSSKLSTGEWHHIAVSYAQAGNSAKIYLDGELEGSGSLSLNIYTNAGELQVGLQDATTPMLGFDGRIDDLVIFNAAVSESTIRNIANNR